MPWILACRRGGRGGGGGHGEHVARAVLCAGRRARGCAWATRSCWTACSSTASGAHSKTHSLMPVVHCMLSCTYSHEPLLKGRQWYFFAHEHGFHVVCHAHDTRDCAVLQYQAGLSSLKTFYAADFATTLADFLAS